MKKLFRVLSGGDLGSNPTFLAPKICPIRVHRVWRFPFPNTDELLIFNVESTGRSYFCWNLRYPRISQFLDVCESRVELSLLNVKVEIPHLNSNVGCWSTSIDRRVMDVQYGCHVIPINQVTKAVIAIVIIYRCVTRTHRSCSRQVSNKQQQLGLSIVLKNYRTSTNLWDFSLSLSL